MTVIGVQTAINGANALMSIKDARRCHSRCQHWFHLYKVDSVARVKRYRYCPGVR